MDIRELDELNEIDGAGIEEQIEAYYDAMQISEEQKEKRREAAKDFWRVFLFLFALIRTSRDNGYLEYDFILIQFRTRFQDVALKYARENDYIREYIDKATRDILNTTWGHIDGANEEYWLSADRGLSIGLNESNSVLNYEELQGAIDEGYRNKTWVAELDRRTRDDHRKMDGTRIPIEEYFSFPDCVMLAPHDEVNGTAEQLVNCRCSLRYS